MPALRFTLLACIASCLSRPGCAFTATGLSPKSNVQVGKTAAASSSAFRPASLKASFTEEAEGTFLDPVAESVSDLCILGLRLGTCALMVHHGIDKLDHVEGFSANVVAKFFGFLPGPPAFWTVSAAGTQIVGAVLLGVGILARPVALSMMATMVTAVAFHLLNTGAEGFPLGVPDAHSYQFELAAMYVAVLAYFSAAGAGAYSLDEKVLGGELQFYEELWNKVSGSEEEYYEPEPEPEPVKKNRFW